MAQMIRVFALQSKPEFEFLTLLKKASHGCMFLWAQYWGMQTDLPDQLTLKKKKGSIQFCEDLVPKK